MNKKILTIDCDGVIMEYVWGRNWARQGRKTSEDGWYRLGYLTWANINHLWRKPLPGVREALKELRTAGWGLILVTSRKEFVRPLTMRWLKWWRLDKYFDGFYFNGFGTSAVRSKEKNIGQIRPTGHIDDNEETVKQLNLKFKNLKIYWLGKTHGASPPKSPFDKGDLKNVVVVRSWGEIVKKVQDRQDE